MSLRCSCTRILVVRHLLLLRSHVGVRTKEIVAVELWLGVELNPTSALSSELRSSGSRMRMRRKAKDGRLLLCRGAFIVARSLMKRPLGLKPASIA